MLNVQWNNSPNSSKATWKRCVPPHPTTLIKVFRLSQGSKAMRDSAMIYLSYAKYVAYGMPESEDMVQDELQG